MYSLERLLHHFYLPGRRSAGLTALLVNYSISQLAAGMAGMFGVLFIFELGSSMMEGLLMVMLFFGIQRLVVAISVPLMGKLIARAGYRWGMLLGLGCLALKLALLTQVTGRTMWLLLPALVLGGLAISGYYLGYHGIFLDDNDDERIGEQMGLITMAGRLSLMISPFLAGLLIDGYGFSTMFAVSVGLLMISVVPLLLMPHHEHKESFKVKKVLGLLNSEPAMVGAVWWWQFENAIQAFFWPVLLFLLAGGSHIRFGLIGSLVMVVNSLAVFLTGKMYDKRPLRRGFPLAAGMVIVSNVLRYTAGSFVWAGLADGLHRLVSPFWWMKIRRYSLGIGEKANSLVFAAGWELIVTGGYLAGLVVGFGLLALSGGEWLWLILPTTLGAVLSVKSLRKEDIYD